MPFMSMKRAKLAPVAGLFGLLLVPMLSVASEGIADISGKALYKQHCAACHGEQGDGQTRASHGLDPRPRDFTTAVSGTELSRERMVLSVTYGRPGTAMTGWHDRLSEQQIEAVVDHVRLTFMQQAESASLANTPANADAATSARLTISAGQLIYQENCAVCHGDKGSGARWTQSSLNPPPRDFTSSQLRGVLTRERMIDSVTHGRPGTAMMSFRSRLTDRDIDDVVGFIRANFMIAANPDDRSSEDSFGHPTTVDMSLPFAEGYIGNAAAGQQFYMNNCYVCHGRDGNGRGPRARFIIPPPRNFLDVEARAYLNRPALFNAITGGKAGTVMPAWGYVLSGQQIADVAEFVFQAFIKPPHDSAAGNTPGDLAKKKANQG